LLYNKKGTPSARLEIFIDCHLLEKEVFIAKEKEQSMKD